jgi:hypothetical protein
VPRLLLKAFRQSPGLTRRCVAAVLTGGVAGGLIAMTARTHQGSVILVLAGGVVGMLVANAVLRD